MGRTASSAQTERAGTRDARIAKARQRRLALDKDKTAREARIDVAVADVYRALADRDDATNAGAAAETRMGAAIRRVLAEGVAMAQVADLTELGIANVQKLKAAALRHAGVESVGAPVDGQGGVDD